MAHDPDYDDSPVALEHLRRLVDIHLLAPLGQSDPGLVERIFAVDGSATLVFRPSLLPLQAKLEQQLMGPSMPSPFYGASLSRESVLVSTEGPGVRTMAAEFAVTLVLRTPLQPRYAVSPRHRACRTTLLLVLLLLSLVAAGTLLVWGARPVDMTRPHAHDKDEY